MLYFIIFKCPTFNFYKNFDIICRTVYVSTTNNSVTSTYYLLLKHFDHPEIKYYDLMMSVCLYAHRLIKHRGFYLKIEDTTQENLLRKLW